MRIRAHIERTAHHDAALNLPGRLDAQQSIGDHAVVVVRRRLRIHEDGGFGVPAIGKSLRRGVGRAGHRDEDDNRENRAKPGHHQLRRKACTVKRSAPSGTL